MMRRTCKQTASHEVQSDPGPSVGSIVLTASSSRIWPDSQLQWLLSSGSECCLVHLLIRQVSAPSWLSNTKTSLCWFVFVAFSSSSALSQTLDGSCIITWTFWRGPVSKSSFRTFISVNIVLTWCKLCLIRLPQTNWHTGNPAARQNSSTRVLVSFCVSG